MSRRLPTWVSITVGVAVPLISGTVWWIVARVRNRKAQTSDLLDAFDPYYGMVEYALGEIPLGA